VPGDKARDEVLWSNSVIWRASPNPGAGAVQSHEAARRGGNHSWQRIGEGMNGTMKCVL